MTGDVIRGITAALTINFQRPLRDSCLGFREGWYALPIERRTTQPLAALYRIGRRHFHHCLLCFSRYKR